jgi:hypothetical protein
MASIKLIAIAEFSLGIYSATYRLKVPYIAEKKPLIMHTNDNRKGLNDVKIKKCKMHDIERQICNTIFLPYLSGRGVINIHPKIAPIKNPEPINTR